MGFGARRVSLGGVRGGGLIRRGGRGGRVLALAGSGRWEEAWAPATSRSQAEQGLSFLGFAVMINALRPDSRSTVEALQVRCPPPPFRMHEAFSAKRVKPCLEGFGSNFPSIAWQDLAPSSGMSLGTFWVCLGYV